MRRLAILAALAAMLVAWGCNESEQAAKETEGSEVLAKVGDKRITQAVLDEELQQVPPMQRREFESPEGQKNFLERVVEMELLYLAAVDAGMDKDADLQKEIERARRTILMRHYYQDRIEAEPSEEQIQSHYEENKESFAKKERVRARLILAESEKDANALLARLEGGEDFAALAAEASTDGATAAEEGNLGWFTRDAYVRGIGVNADFTSRVFDLDAGMISKPIEVKDKGWALVKVEEKDPAGYRELDEVRGEITRRMAPKLKEEAFRQRLEELKTRYGVEYSEQPVAEAASPEELFVLAQNAQDPAKRIEYYQQVVDRFGDSEQADRAMFMVGFVYSEEIQDKDRARVAFEAFMERYPDSDLVKDARYMLDALDGKEPPFEMDEP